MKHQARKRFGQNFLTNRQIIDQIITFVNPQPGENLLEVGPGLGALTLPLLDRGKALQVVEIDRDLIAKLNSRALDGLIVHDADVLQVDWSDMANDRPLRIVGNLPYNVGTPLMLNLLAAAEHVQDIHVMLQKEVVDRLCATVGSRAFGRLSVMMQSGFTIEHLLAVPPDAFSPAPKVQSAVVRLLPNANRPNVKTCERLSNATRLAFANKRKTLRNNLKHLISAEELLAVGVDPTARAETLTVDQFLTLAEMIPLPSDKT